MNEFDYATMIEIPVSSCDVTVKKPKRFKFFGRTEAQKKQLIDAVNSEEAAEEIFAEQQESAEEFFEDAAGYEGSVQIMTKEKPKRAFKFDIITAQIGVIVALVLTVMLTNLFWEDSGINNLIKGAFAPAAVEEDVSYTEFSPTSPTKGAEVTLTEGVMSFTGAGSIYSVCDGKVTKVAQNADKYDISIEYSPSFTAVISGADYAYYSEGESVYRSVPVCYSESGEVKVYLYSDGQLLKNYVVDNGKIVWQS